MITAQNNPHKELVATTSFLKDWTPEQFGPIQIAIAKHFSRLSLKTYHGTHIPKYRPFEDLCEIIGFAYTSSSSYAGYWITNTEVYYSYNRAYRYIGFAISKGGKYCAILWDKDENELIIEL